MPVAERTYSFKARASLVEDLHNARQALVEIQKDEEAYEELVHEFARRLALWKHEDDEGNQSALMRSVFLFFIAAVEKTHDDRRYASEYEALARERTPEDDEFVRAAVSSVSGLWQDE